MPLPIPDRVPELGFYYHYKHDPRKSINDYAYEVVGIGFHTEEARPGEEHFAIYRPLYEASVYKAAKDLGIPCYDSRPLTMWLETVQVGVAEIPRFRQITDLETIRALSLIRDKMY